ncbi:MAG TPA: DUF1343 domain-containing protein [Chitinophagaceae bacterium]|nr:DUF1343 domain-containing protein [Chitinophagaceae bacterium]
MKIIILVFFYSACIFICKEQKAQKPATRNKPGINSYNGRRIICGDERINVYLPLIRGKRVGIFANQTSMIGQTHLVDTLKKLGIDIRVIFGPEHGFRGNASAGEEVGNYIDEKTGVPVVSLYGNKRKPSADDLKDIDILIFDIQDVGVRFYTFISSLQDFMEAAFENSKPLMILDRPNPNGFYVDGPVLDPKFKSFVGMQPVPVVYGMTIAEYAFMIAGEKWLTEKANRKYDYYLTAENSDDTPFHFQVIKCQNYVHASKYILPVKPSPNLPEIQSIYLYPSTCFFEGTVFSEGRGTDKPFEVFGHPLLPKNLYAFTPRPNEGAKSSKHYYEICHGWNLHGSPEEVLKKINNHIQLKWLINAYKLFPGKDTFFLKANNFNRLAGNDVLMQQVKDGKSEEEIRKSWQPALLEFKKTRKKYLLYEDFE